MSQSEERKSVYKYGELKSAHGFFNTKRRKTVYFIDGVSKIKKESWYKKI